MTALVFPSSSPLPPSPPAPQLFGQWFQRGQSSVEHRGNSCTSRPFVRPSVHLFPLGPNQAQEGPSQALGGPSQALGVPIQALAVLNQALGS